MTDSLKHVISYEYALGAIQASPFLPMSSAQLNRMRDADYNTALRLLAESGYEPAPGGSVNETIDNHLEMVAEFIRAHSPDNELTGLLFFEEDALNLKMYIKAVRFGVNADTADTPEGAFDKELLKVCATVGDYSLLGKEAEKHLEGIDETDNPSKLSCMVDNAMFARSVAVAKKKGEKGLVKLLEAYAAGRNALTKLRLKRLGMDISKCSYAFLPYGDDFDKQSNVLTDINSSLEKVYDELKYDTGFGFIARLYLMKKNEAAVLRLIFAGKEKSEVE
ncbi:MAG: V-type ATPase subunit [Eubacteriales bacterium]|jgi:ankyrin repeat protein